MGERREYPAFLVNNGPQPVPFKFGFLQGLRNLDENYEDEKNSFTSPAEVGKELTDRVLTTFPLSGVVGPYQQVPISFICRTKKFDKKGGFSDQVGQIVESDPRPSGSALSGARSQVTQGSGTNKSISAIDKSRYSVKPQDYASLAIVRFDEDSKFGVHHADLKIQMMARAQYPEIKINRQTFEFGECHCNERRDMVLSIRNKSDDLPLDFNFSKVAQFRATPARGKLLPGAEHTINISFEPKNLGNFGSEMSLEILKGTYKTPIKLSGSSNKLGQKGKVLRGPAAKGENFDPERHPISDDQATITQVDRLIGKKQRNPDKVLTGLDEHQLEEKEDNIKEYLRIKANKTRFNTMVKHQRLNRDKDMRITQKIKETQKAPPMSLEEIKDDLNLGMDAPTAEPRFEFVQEVDPLYVEKPIGQYEPTATNLDRMRARK